jgi:hypothetical protein
MPNMFMAVVALALSARAAVNLPCLCIFDIDRTLTGKQSDTQDCPANSIENGIEDRAYGGGTLTLSAVARAVNKTFCRDCYKAAISAGDADGPTSAERTDLYTHLQHLLPTNEWAASGCDIVNSPLVTSCQDGHKQTAVPKIVAWYGKRGVTVADEDVYFFDDRVENILPFFANGLRYNAHQVSCATRDDPAWETNPHGSIGLCGGTLEEVVPLSGVSRCGASTCENPCMTGGREYTCAGRIKFSMTTAGGSISEAAAIQKVNDECHGQCSCALVAGQLSNLVQIDVNGRVPERHLWLAALVMMAFAGAAVVGTIVAFSWLRRRKDCDPTTSEPVVASVAVE